MGDILKEIAEYKRGFVAERKRGRSLADLRSHARDSPEPEDFQAVLMHEGMALIAEVKKASPSKGKSENSAAALLRNQQQSRQPHSCR